MMFPQRKLGLLQATVALLLLLLAPTHAEGPSSSLLESCRSDGFDPWQLSCETCALLPAANQPRCQECCQSYKTSERMTKPYESAVLVHRQFAEGGDSEMEQFLNEHWEDVVEEKGANRLIKLENADAQRGTGFWFMRPPSQMLLWFHEIVEPGKKLKVYKENAKEIVLLDGYKKDDMKDMLTTLLPKKK